MRNAFYYRIFIAFLFLFIFGSYSSQSQDRVKKVVLQGFWWDYWNNNFRYAWANYLTELAPRLKAMGIDAIWIPPAAKNSSPGSVGYAPFDMYDLGDKYQKGGDSLRVQTRSGTKDELLRMIAVMHANGIEVIEDMVLNHNSDAGAFANGQGGQDPQIQYSMASSNGFKNFRYVSYKTPSIDESVNDYWTRSGRFAKNYTNFHPNPSNNCNSGDICADWWGPDIDYETPSAFGPSTNIPTSGSATMNGITRPFYNPAQSSNYMTINARDNMSWFKKQTGVDGWRFDAVKHYPLWIQRDFITTTKYNLPAWANGDTTMLSISEWVGTAGDMDFYVSGISGGGPVPNEEHTGTFDFSLRGYGFAGGLYSMVLSGGSFDVRNLPSAQQSKRYFDYGTKRVHRTVPFVNNHDTYRPKLQANGNFLAALGDASGWDTPNELGGNGNHIDPREPRLFSAYATTIAMDGNPMIFFEDLFDIGTTGKRWTHMPANETDLPIRKDIRNLIQAHQKLSFKDGNYAVPTAAQGPAAPFYAKGAAADHLVLERRGKAIIGVTDVFNAAADNSQDQEVWITVGDPSWYNLHLVDYSGAHGITTTQVQADGRVLIKTTPVGHNIPGANGHGYSIWAPVPTGVTFSNVADIATYLSAYTPGRSTRTTQEWEMADDLGDSHCKSLGQGGRLPDNATNERIVGKITSAAGTLITCKLIPEIDGRDLTITLSDANGKLLSTASGISTIASPLTLNYTPMTPGWVVAKVRNTTGTYAGQKCWVNIAYTAPAIVSTSDAASVLPTNVSIWTGNKNSTDISDCGNWEGGAIPSALSNVIVYGHAKPFPVLTSNLTINKLTLEQGATFTVNTGIELKILSQ